jgi:hypothetical protein
MGIHNFVHSHLSLHSYFAYHLDECTFKRVSSNLKMGVVYSVSDVFSASREGNTELYLTPIFKLVSSRAELPRPSGTSKGLQRVTHFAPHMTRFRYRPSKFDLFTFSRVYATSRHIPGVRFAGISHPGLIGTAPSSELLATWNKREGALIAEHLNSVPPVAFPPEPIGAYVGQEIGKDVMEKVANEGARTIPGREHGGNCDVSLYSCFFRRFCGRMCSWLVF